MKRKWKRGQLVQVHRPDHCTHGIVGFFDRRYKGQATIQQLGSDVLRCAPETCLLECIEPDIFTVRDIFRAHALGVQIEMNVFGANINLDKLTKKKPKKK